ncbi:MAG: transporter, ATPase component [Candidatus Saccharibacteria bacterium]|jgi:ABC-2 type transport system ATP-binding protein|nr:transporter, ATPase component [Candidatus Saccharibacteria bacterium]
MRRAPALQVHDLQVRRSRNFALNVDSLWVDKGSVLCIAGANGSGKTTLIEAIVGLTPYQGSIRIMGRPIDLYPKQAKARLGYVPDDDQWFVPELTAAEYFALLSSVYERSGVSIRAHMSKIVQHTADRLKFKAFDQQLGSLSHGNKKKVQIIAALMHEPQLVVVDELRNGLDPLAIRAAEQLFKSLSARGVAVVAATHDLWWAERFAAEIVMLDQGRVILDAPTGTITAESGSVEAKFLALYGAARD